MSQVLALNPQPEHQIAPHNIEVEQALLGAILVNNDAMDRVSKFLLPEHFFEPIHQSIFMVAVDMIERGKSVSPITIKSFLPAHDIVGEGVTVAQYLARLATEATTILNARDYGEGIYDHWLRRKVISMATDVTDVAYDLPADGNVLEFVADFEDQLSEIRTLSIDGDVPTGARYQGTQFLEGLSAAYQRKEIKGVALPLKELEYVLSEKVLEAGNLYGFLSASNEGKTSMAVQMVVSALYSQSPVLILSYDQSPDQFFRQIMAQTLGIDAAKQRRGDISEEDFRLISLATEFLRDSPFEIIKCNDQKAIQLVPYVRQFTKRTASRSKGVPLIMMDHTQRVRKHDERAHEGSVHLNISGVCKAAAGEYGAAWLSLMQRNSKGSHRKNPRPIDADIYGGEIAKADYDYILYLYRQEVYLQKQLNIADPSHTKSATDERDRLSSELLLQKNKAEIGLLKSRFGDITRRRDVKFIPEFTRYESLEVEQQLLPGQELF